MDDFLYRALLILCFFIIATIIVAYEWFWEKREREAEKRHEARMQELRDWERFFDYLDEQSYFLSESDYRKRVRVVDDTTKTEEEGK